MCNKYPSCWLCLYLPASLLALSHYLSICHLFSTLSLARSLCRSLARFISRALALSISLPPSLPRSCYLSLSGIVALCLAIPIYCSTVCNIYVCMHTYVCLFTRPGFGSPTLSHFLSLHISLPSYTHIYPPASFSLCRARAFSISDIFSGLQL